MKLIMELAASCRTCMEENRRYYEIHDSVDETHTIVEMLSELVPQINIREEDDIEFSSLICETCVDQLIASFAFHRLCIETDTRLRELIIKPVEQMVVEQQNDGESSMEGFEENSEVKIEYVDEFHMRDDEVSDATDSDFSEESNQTHYEGEENNQPDPNSDENLITRETDDEEFKIAMPLKIIKINEFKRFSCTDCGKIYDRMSRIQQHLEKKHKYNLDDIKMFMQFCEDNITHETKFGRKNLTSMSAKERKKYVGSREFPCEVCGKIFDCISRLKRHAPVHSSDKPYTCEICMRGCSNLNSLKRHKMLHAKKEEEKNTNQDPPEGYKCPYCPKCYPSKNALSSHRLVHAAENATYSCEVCKRKYMTMRTLCEHIKKAHPDRTFSCKECDKKFVLEEQLSRHLHSHRTIDLTCAICEKEFTSELAVKEHMYIHTGENPYLCPTCGKTFKYSSSLRKHIERHTEEKKYQCSECSRCFKCRVDLYTHKKVHLGIKPFKCNICGYRFTRPSYLKRHKELHFRKNPHKCYECKMMFASITSLKRHLRIHNNDEGDTNSITMEQLNEDNYEK
uniref:Uncharacterized protein n=1 Tax=Stomoxys calcitrans TaxID=35570 RepID=A0A1I8PRH9_STOCA